MPSTYTCQLFEAHSGCKYRFTVLDRLLEEKLLKENTTGNQPVMCAQFDHAMN